MIKKDPLILSFKLDNDISLRSVLRLPILLSMGATLNLLIGKIICSELNFLFPLLLDPTGKGLSDGICTLDSNLCVPLGVLSNLTSLVHYIAMDGFANSNPNQVTSSNNIMLQDSFYHGSVSRNLSFGPSSKNTVT